VTSSSKAPFLHVANGTSTTGIIASAGIPGTLSIWADPLHDGPVPGGLTDAELLSVRGEYLAGHGSGAAPNPVNDLRRWRTAIEQTDSYEELVLWYEHDVFDQLNLIQLLPWIRQHLPATVPASLVCIGSFPGHPVFRGLGELSPNELGPLLDRRQRISEAQYVVAEDAWRAFLAHTPEPLDNLRHTDTSAMPFLAPAITRFLEEYPWTRDGLSRTERRLLTLAMAGPVDLMTAYPRMHDDEVYYLTDSAFAALVRDLASTSPPLIRTDLHARAGSVAPGGTVMLTETGRAVLNGQKDRVTTCGIDRWFGGVHLRSDQGDVWRWDGGRHRIVRTT
jgi:hypothetical protein